MQHLFKEGLRKKERSQTLHFDAHRVVNGVKFRLLNGTDVFGNLDDNGAEIFSY